MDEVISLRTGFEGLRKSFAAGRYHVGADETRIARVAVDRFNDLLNRSKALIGTQRPGLLKLENLTHTGYASCAADGDLFFSWKQLDALCDAAISELTTWSATKEELATFVSTILGDKHAVVPRKQLVFGAILVVLALCGIGWAAVRAAVYNSAVAEAAKEAERFRDLAEEASEQAQIVLQTAKQASAVYPSKSDMNIDTK